MGFIKDIYKCRIDGKSIYYKVGGGTINSINKKYHNPKNLDKPRVYNITINNKQRLFNVIINIVGNKYNWSLKKRYLIFTFISWFSTISISTNLKSYNFSPREWNKYYIYLLVKYIILWNFIVINIEKNM